MIKLGPAGLGPVKSAEEILKYYSSNGIRCCEISFTYSVYMKKDDAIKIGNKAKSLGVDLSIHAPYFINLNSEDPEKRRASMKRILNCCKVGHYLQAKKVVFHPGYYGKDREAAYTKIKDAIFQIMDEIGKNNWNIKLAPEVMGKINVFGSLEEISKLVKETGCSFCLDFAHILARYKRVDYGKILKLFPQKDWHLHFSGIEYSNKGERRHLKTKKKEWGNLFENLPKNRNIIIINESPDCINHSLEGLKILSALST